MVVGFFDKLQLSIGEIVEASDAADKMVGRPRR